MDIDKFLFDNPFDLTYKIEVSKWKILVVDSSYNFYHQIEESVGNFKFEEKKVEFIHTTTYDETLKIVRSNPDIAIAFIYRNIEKLNDGLDVISYIRNTLEDNNIKLIVLSEDHEDGYDTMINYKINDYIEKSQISKKRIFASFIATLRSYNDTIKTIQLKNRLEELVDSRTIELIEANTKNEKNLREMKEDLKSGKAIQMKLLPKTDTKINNYTFDYLWKPALYLSGDILEYFSIDENHIAFYLADVSGHGISSAFITIYLKSLIHQYTSSYNARGDWTVLDPPKMLSIINRELLHEDLDKHLTMFYGIINTIDNRLIYSTGGHYPYPVLFNDEKSEFISNRGFSLGNFDIAEYQRYEMFLPNKFDLLLLTDGFLDIMPFDENLEKEKFILNLKKNNEELSIKGVLDKIDFKKVKKLPDDLTILHIKNY